MHPDRTLVAADVRLHTLRWPGGGHEPAFVLVHGLASNARLWSGVADRLAQRGHPALAPDLRGHGRSDRPDAGYDTATAADDVAALIDRLGLDRPVVVGQSWGGNVVLDLAARHDGLVRGIACLDGGWIEPSIRYPEWDDCARALSPPDLDGLAATRVESALRAAHPDWAAESIAAAMANFERRPDGTVRPLLRRDRHLAIVRDLWERHPPAQYREVSVPALLLPVAGDGTVGEQTREDVAKAEALLPVARTRWLEGDHDVHAQQPDLIAGILADAAAQGFWG